jgi:nucleoside-diphosphate-sugar epimerase
MKLLATGCSGGIGRYLRADTVIDFRKFQSGGSLTELPDHANESTLIHLAAMTSIKQVQDNPAESYKVNVSSTIDLFRTFASNRGQRFIFASTGHVYGKTPIGHLTNENDSVNPFSLYAEQKILAERKLLREAENSGVEVIILRIFSVFGLGMKAHFLAGRIEASMENLGATSLILNSDDVRDFSSPRDIASLVRQSAEIPVRGSLIVNLCTGRGTSVREIVKLNFPNIKNDRFVRGNSETPRLVGDPKLKNLLYTQSELDQ